MMKRIGVLGSGVVGEVLANGLLAHGYQVMRASREPSKLKDWVARVRGEASIGNFAEACTFGEGIVLAVKGTAAEAALDLVGHDKVTGKIVIDTTNPIADLPPVNGVLQFFTGPNESLMERLQSRYPEARFVKAFSCVGSMFMVRPDFGSLAPTMFTCGNDPRAKEEVAVILRQFGWDIEDLGAAEAARAIEPLCMLWCIPGIRNNSWSHAFRLLRKGTSEVPTQP